MKKYWLSPLFVGILSACCLGNPPIDEEFTSGIEGVTGFDNRTNGFVTQEQFDEDKEEFEEQETPETGLGPVYNANSCAACHANPITGGNSQITELRAGKFENGVFSEHPGGSLIQARATNEAIQERVFSDQNVRALRSSTSILGLGFIECISNTTITDIRNNQPEGVKGTVTLVNILEAPGTKRVGRFGHKGQQASLISFSADAYLNEMGITSPLLPTENTSNGNDVSAFDPSLDPEDPGGEQGFGKNVEQFARFMRATKAPPRDFNVALSIEATRGERIFKEIGCADCHTPSIKTQAPGVWINGQTFKIPEALGGKVVHPYSDFMLHDIGSGDGIVQGEVETRNKMRTTPLWGLHTRDRLFHDGQTFTRNDAILRHAGQATCVINKYRALSDVQKRELLVFLRSL